MWTRGPINRGFKWVSLFYEYLCGCSCQNWFGSIFQPTVTILITVLEWDFLTENLIILCCAWNNSSETIFFPQPQKKKSCRMPTQCFSRLCECLYTWPSWCYPMERFQMRFFAVHFDWKSCCLCACHNIVMNFIPQA